MEFLSSYASYLVAIPIILFALSNLKVLPLVWHFRLFTILLQSRHWRSPKWAIQGAANKGSKLSTIFQPLVLTTRSPLLEIDFYLHKNNSTFFSDLDIARGHFVGALLWPIMSKPPSSMTDGKGTGSMLSIILGGVACTFKREIKPYEKFEIWTKVLCWDEKWIYFVSHFVRADKVTRGRNGGWSLQPWKKAKQGVEDEMPPEKAVLASAVSKCIFRHGRESVVPQRVLHAAGLLPSDKTSLDAVEKERERGVTLAEAMAFLTSAHDAFQPHNGPVLAEYKDVWAL